MLKRLCAVIVTLCVGFVHAQSEPSVPQTLKDAAFITQNGDQWQLTFHDEFDGDTLDASKWTLNLPWAGTDGEGRHHNPLYGSYIMDHNVQLGGGVLKLLTRREDVKSKDGRTFHYTQAMITTAKTFRQQYGYFEARVKLPIDAGPGLWPAFWTLADGWPPEMDICEVWTSFNRSHQGMAYKLPGDPREKWDDENIQTPLPAAWTTYGMEWGPGYQLYNINGKITKRVHGSHVDANRHYILLNSGVDAKNPPRETTTFPDEFLVDYVRVYSSPAMPTVHNGDFSLDSLKPWTTYGQVVVNEHNGHRSARIDGPRSGIEQVIYGLKPNTEYTIMANASTANKNVDARFGIKHFEATGKEPSTKVPFGVQYGLEPHFVTGPNSTSATIYLYVPETGTVDFHSVIVFESLLLPIKGSLN